MEISNLKYIVGKAEANKPAIIRFFGPVDQYTTRDFNDEFLYLQNCVQPSKIVVMINSEGGSVVYGMSTFSVIQSCPIPVDCVIEGLAASMGSIIWAAGDRLYMHDYSLLMVHNPFMRCAEEADANTKATIEAFRGQLETIYCKRFAMKKEDVQKMMNGEDNVDGTYFSAKEAVAAGIISKENIIKTSKHIRDEIHAKIDGVTDAASLRDIMASAVEAEDYKLGDKMLAILEQNNESTINQSKMEPNSNPIFAALMAQLGFAEDSQLTNVSNRIAELIQAEAELKIVKSKYDDLQIKFTGKETEVANLTEKLGKVEGQLKQYQNAEAAARAEEINALIEKAVEDGKIKAESKAKWIEMANANLETVKETLDSIAGRQVITQAIANDPENRADAAAGATPAERELAEMVKAAVGADFQFKKLED